MCSEFLSLLAFTDLHPIIAAEECPEECGEDHFQPEQLEEVEDGLEEGVRVDDVPDDGVLCTYVKVMHLNLEVPYKQHEHEYAPGEHKADHEKSAHYDEPPRVV